MKIGFQQDSFSTFQNMQIMQQRYFHFLSFLFILALAANSAFAQVYVKSDATGANNGTSWADAYTDLTAALDNTASGQIWVAKGTYKPGGTTPTASSVFTVSNPVEIYGGFAGTETMLSQRNPTANVTTLSSDISDNDVTGDFTNNKSDNTRHVISVVASLANPVTIDGFSIKGGHTSNVAGDPAFNRSGGGIHAMSRVIVNNCKFTNNFGRTGGCIFLGAGAGGSEVTNSSFSNNSTSLESAGVYAMGLANLIFGSCTFSNNSTVGGAVLLNNCSAPSIDNCTFESNTNAGAAGGAMHLINCTNITLSNSKFLTNTATIAGALVYDSGDQATTDPNNLVMTNCEFKSNTASNGVGGAMRNVQGSYTMINCTFEENSATSSGGQIRNDTNGDNVVYNNCTFRKGNSGGWGGAHTSYGAGVYTIKNCLYTENVASRLGGCVNHGFEAMSSYDSCTFSLNTSTTSSGGALALQNNNTSIVVTNSFFGDNKCEGSGGAIFSGATSSSSIVAVDKCEFITNSAVGASSFGGAINVGENGPDIATLTLTNSIFGFNSAALQGGALNLSDINANITSCLFYENSAIDPGTGGAISNNCSDSNHVEVLILNTTFADNYGDLAAGIANWTDTVEILSNTTIQNCIFRNSGGINYVIEAGFPNVISKGGNISDDLTLETYLTHPKDINGDEPTFVNIYDSNYRLKDGSLGINAGVSDGAPALDLDVNPRLGEVDMGAYENQNVTRTEETLLPNNGALKLFPNPAAVPSVAAELKTAWTGELSIRIVNALGQTVHLSKVMKNSPEMKLELNVEALRTGVYDVLVSNGKEVVVERLVKF
jgi:hypothetical protein